MKNKYEAGDILLIEDEIVCIDAYTINPTDPGLSYYSIRIVKPKGKEDIVSSELFDTFVEARVLGNISVNQGWKVLYGRPVVTKQRT